MPFYKCLSLTIGLLLAAAPGMSADLKLVSYRFGDEAPVPHLHLSGTFQKGDADRIAAQFAALTLCSGRLCYDDFGPQAVITLDSPGGVYSTGVALADFFRAEKIATYVATGDSCLSACALAFLGGSAFWPTGGIGTYTDRRIDPGARLGFHSPYFTPATAERAVREDRLPQLLDGTRLAIADIVETLSRYHVSQQVLHRIIRMGPDQFYEVSTPGTLVGIRASLPGFDPALLAVPWRTQVTQVCRHLAAEHYALSPEDLRDMELGAPIRAEAEDGTPIVLFALDDRPLNVSGCGVAASAEGAPVTSMALYAWNGEPDTHRILLSFQSSNTGGWSSFAYRGGRATDGYVTTGSLNHMLMPLDSDLSTLPAAVLAQIRAGRGQDATPPLPSHSRNWPVTVLHETPWSRSATAQDLIIVEQTGPPQILDDIPAQAEDTVLLYSFDGDSVVVRSGEDPEQGTSYYWLGLRAGDRAATLRIQAPVAAQNLTQAQRDLMAQIVCGADFQGTHLGCYR